MLEGCDVARHATTTQVFGEVVVAPKAITSREKLLQAGGPAKKSGQAPEAARARDGERLLPAGRLGSGLGAAVTQQHPSHSNPPVRQVAQHTNPRRGGQERGGSQAGKGKGFFLVARPAA